MASDRSQRKVLATDLDGTLIPLQGNKKNVSDLRLLAKKLGDHQVGLVFVTGRDIHSVQEAITEFQLPQPDFVICDVGTSLFRRNGSCQFDLVQPFADTLERIMDGQSMAQIRQAVESKTIVGLRAQEDEKQGRFKLSFYSTPTELSDHTAQINDAREEIQANVQIISSVDPFNDDGLIDLLPKGVSKAFALQWWCDSNQIYQRNVVFAGDTGNDLAALTAGFNAIVVGNAADSVVEFVQDFHIENGWSDRLCVCENEATSGVLEGCEAFKIFR